MKVGKNLRSCLLSGAPVSREKFSRTNRAAVSLDFCDFFLNLKCLILIKLSIKVIVFFIPNYIETVSLITLIKRRLTFPLLALGLPVTVPFCLYDRKLELHSFNSWFLGK